MHRLLLAALAAVALTVGAVPAQAGAPIARLPECPNSYLFYGPAISRPDYRAALLCLVNGARAAQGLPALKRSAPLEAVAQGQAEKFAKTGSGGHGKSLTDITKRFAQHGYKAAAYNEAFGLADAGASPYVLLSEMVRKSGVPCSEIFDPRWKDVGIGVSAPAGGFVTTATLELGRRAGTEQPSSKTGPMATCGHKIPAPKLTGYAVDVTGPPTTGATTLTATFKCIVKSPCAFTATASLPNAKATAPAQSLTLGAGQTQAVTFTFDAAALTAERAAAKPTASIAIDATQPAPYKDTLSGPLPAATAGVARLHAASVLTGVRIAKVHAAGKYSAEYVQLRNTGTTTQTIPAASPSGYQLTVSKGKAKVIQFDDARVTLRAGQTVTVRFRCAPHRSKPTQSGATAYLCLDRGHGGYGSVDLLPDGGATVKLVDDASGKTLSRLTY